MQSYQVDPGRTSYIAVKSAFPDTRQVTLNTDIARVPCNPKAVQRSSILVPAILHYQIDPGKQILADTLCEQHDWLCATSLCIFVDTVSRKIAEQSIACATLRY